MPLKHRTGYAFRTVAGLLASSLLAAASCSLRDLEAVSVGVTAATQHLEDKEDITFGEWLLDELKNLND